MEGFRVGRFVFELEALEPLFLPAYKGSTLRGGFGTAFKRTACVLRSRQCETCLLLHTCVYSYVFETPPPADAAMLRKYPRAPHPFVLEPPDDQRESLLPGESFSFSLVLIGRGIDYLPYFIYSIHTLGQMGIGRGRGKFALRAVYEEALDGPLLDGRNLKKIYDHESQILEGPSGGLAWEELLRKMRPPSEGRVTLRFRTPARMRYQGRYVDALEFHILLRNLLRRISSLSYFHCGRPLDLDFKGLIRLAHQVETERSDLRWHDWERYSARQRSRMKMGGILGTVTFRGDVGPFWPYLVLGQAVHVGKGTSFGLGKYEIIQDSPAHG